MSVAPLSFPGDTVAPPVTSALFIFPSLVSSVTPDYGLTSEDLELGASNEKVHLVFVFLGLIPTIFKHDILWQKKL